jgi:hypothetical protein
MILSVLCVLMAAVFSGTAANAAATTNLPPLIALAADSYAGRIAGSAQTGQTVSRPTQTAIRASESWTLPQGFLISDQNGVKANYTGEYYIDATGLMPGDVVKKTVTIQNLEQTDGPQASLPYALSFRAEPMNTEGPVDLFEEVSLELKLDGKVIYNGNSRGDKGTDGTGKPVNMITTPLDLGQYKIGDRRDMEVTLTVSQTMQVYEKISEAKFRWYFYAVKAEPTNPPATGFLDSFGPYLIPVAGMLLLALFLVLKKKKNERDAQPAPEPNAC